jgi:hypothetical protein
LVSKIKTGYRCSICDKVYPRDTLALNCEQSHDTILVPFIREDLYKLLQFLLVRDDALLSESLMKTLRRYSRGAYH